MALPLPNVRALVFDVFGTVTNWRGSVIAELGELGRAKNIRGVDWARFAEEWRREGYSGAIAAIGRGEREWVDADTLHRTMLDELLRRYDVRGLTEAEIDNLSKAWHRLDPWPDSVPGLTQLKSRYTVATLSNGNFALLLNMAKRAGLPWDCIISAEMFRAYKPDPAVYQGAARLLRLRNDEVALVAAHVGDLRGAQVAGLRTAYVPRPLEWGHGGHQPDPPDPSFDVVATDFVDLAEQLGA